MLEDASASVIDCHVRGNGNDRLVSHARRGTRVHGDDVGAGVVLHAGAEATLQGNSISMNAGVGLFVHADARAVLSGNAFRSNRGDAVAGRPQAETVFSDAERRKVEPMCVVRRQRVPFEWTVGASVSADDKSLEERVAEMRQQYEAQRGDGSGLAMLPSGADPSVVCSVQ